MNTLDMVFLGIILVFALRCLMRGFVTEVMETAAIIGGVISGIVFYRPAGAIIGKLSGLTTFLEAIGFAAAFLLAFGIVKVAESVVDRTVEAANLGTLDKALGFLLGAAEGILVTCVALILVTMQTAFDAAAMLDGSIAARLLLPLIAQQGALPR